MVTPISTPTSTPQSANLNAPAQFDPAVETALNNALPNVDTAALFGSLDKLFGYREYTLVGSASMHIHAIDHKNPNITLPPANDLDLVLKPEQILNLDLSGNKLREQNLKYDNVKKELYYKREDGSDLTIDLIHTTNRRFANCSTVEIGGFNVRTLLDSMDSYKTRFNDSEFRAAVGGVSAAKDAVQPWFDYFDSYSLEGNQAPVGPSAAAAQPAQANQFLPLFPDDLGNSETPDSSVSLRKRPREEG